MVRGGIRVAAQKDFGDADIPDAASYVMFDLEGMPPHFDELENVYLWGAQVFGERAGEYRAAVAEFDEDGDRRNWFAFLEIVRDIFKEHGDIPFVHWADYERSHINTYIKRYGDLRSAGARLLANLVNLLKVTEVSMVIPVPSYSLKVIEQHVGYNERRRSLAGSGRWRNLLRRRRRAPRTRDSN